ncbi:winged helix-turn-helix domain-containing protein [Deinococcus aetherius]|uniref:winged helix-turn-helix domain-containing protein n=1 Tax=Deinococcus aetherius TaxID=200252 RepID=UPI0029F48525|nr:response regulator transcription factor [Deinococcus aetherius]
MRALLRRASLDGPEVLTNGPLSVNLSAAEVHLAGRRLTLTRREFDLLAFLTRHVGVVCGRTELLERVWGPAVVHTGRTVDQHVAQLRALLEDTPAHPTLLETVRGQGYRMRRWGG